MKSSELIHVETRLVQSQALFTNQVDDEVVMLNLETDKYFGADPVGSRIWALLAEPRTISQICDLLQTEYDVDRVTCEDDVIQFVEQLRSEGLVRIDE